MSSETKQQVTLRASDDGTYTVERAVAEKSGLINQMIEGKSCSSFILVKDSEGGRDQGLGEELGGSINYALDWVVNDFRDLEISRCLFVSPCCASGITPVLCLTARNGPPFRPTATFHLGFHHCVPSSPTPPTPISMFPSFPTSPPLTIRSRSPGYPNRSTQCLFVCPRQDSRMDEPP
jgi:hypothetical protein